MMLGCGTALVMMLGCGTALVMMLAQPFVSFDSNAMCKLVSSPTHVSAKQTKGHGRVFSVSNL